MKSGQKVFRVLNIRTLMWFKKNSSYGGGRWVAREDQGSLWTGVGHLKNAFGDGSLRDERKADLQIVEYTVTFERGEARPATTFLDGSK